MSVDYKKFKGDLGSGGPFLKAKDFEDGREVIVLPWVHNGEVIMALVHYEGWVWDGADGQKKNKKKPVRFSFDEYSQGIDFDQHDFSTSTYQGKTTRDIPKGCIAMLFKDVETREIKLASFTQVTLCNSLLKYLDKDEKFYVKNLDKKILVIGKENERTWSAIVKDDEDDIGSDFETALSEFTFSWQKYLDGEKEVFEDGDTWQDVIDIRGDGPPPPEKKSPAKKTTPKKESKEKAPDKNISEDAELAATWYKVKTPQGTLFAKLTKDQLQSICDTIKNKMPEKYQDNLMYKAAAYGVKVRQEEDGEREGLDADDIAF